MAWAFEPFYTIKPFGQSTGLRLSQVYGFVSQSRGIVRIESALLASACYEAGLQQRTGVIEFDSVDQAKAAASDLAPAIRS